MKNIKAKDIIIPAVSLFVICVVVSALLAGTNALTKAPIEQNSIEKTNQAMQSVCSFATEFSPVEVEDSAVICYEAKDGNGEVKGYAFSVSAKGYGGDVSVMVGISADGKVSGVEILSHSETPGLGANCTKEDFLADFLQEIPENGFEAVKDSSGGENGKIDALTGATITSTAVSNCVNHALEVYGALTGGEQ